MTIILQYTEDLGSCFLFALDTGSGSEWNSNNENAYEEALLQALKRSVAEPVEAKLFLGAGGGKK